MVDGPKGKHSVLVVEREAAGIRNKVTYRRLS